MLISDLTKPDYVINIFQDNKFEVAVIVNLFSIELICTYCENSEIYITYIEKQKCK